MTLHFDRLGKLTPKRHAHWSHTRIAGILPNQAIGLRNKHPDTRSCGKEELRVTVRQNKSQVIDHVSQHRKIRSCSLSPSSSTRADNDHHRRSPRSRAETILFQRTPCDGPRHHRRRRQRRGTAIVVRFWCIIIGLGITNLLGALENTVVSTAARVILTDLQLGERFIWITDAFFVCSAAFQPLFGQMCNVFGRRWVTMAIVAIFTLGSGICGGATSGAMLIAGRAVQGIGSGGIIMVIGSYCQKSTHFGSTYDELLLSSLDYAND